MFRIHSNVGIRETMPVVILPLWWWTKEEQTLRWTTHGTGGQFIVRIN